MDLALLFLDTTLKYFLVKGNLPSFYLIIFSPHTRRSIHVTSLATGWSAVVVAGVAEGVTSVAVDPSRGRLYWASPGAVTSATLAGDTVEDILTRWVDNNTGRLSVGAFIALIV